MSSLHQRAKEIFLAAVARPAAQRLAFLSDACGGDDQVRREVESLLAFHHDQDIDEERPVTETAPTDAEPVMTAWAAGEVFAGRYRMIARIGRGGMGDVWRADDLVLHTPVALKLIHATGPDARERIVSEVRLARQITHPAVCRVFDVGETASGVVFYSMELVQGEDLASLLRRVGRLPSDRVVDIARQLCAGLAAAHAQGVLHRDLKPANILVDADGSVRITDFGIAIPRTDAGLHKLTGTPGYMAPEQRAQGMLSEQTDVYALGLVLYELLAGRHPFPPSRTSDEPTRPSTLAPDVHPQLERLVLHALSADPRHRPASAMDLSGKLPPIGARRDAALVSVSPAGSAVRARRRFVLTALAIASVVLALAFAGSHLFAPRTGGLTGQDTVVLADFENTTGEPVFDGALRVALSVAFEQSPFVRVFPDERARETLRLMRRSPDTRVTRPIAREIALRERLKALIAGSIARLGQHYVITLQAINAETGDAMAREQVEATSKEQVLTALGAATSRMRGTLGESLASVQRFDAPLPRATTASLDALHAYALALSEGVEVPRLEAIPQLERAIELDPSFAMAQAFLSSVYANTGQSARAPAFSRRAFELRDRVSERERFFISWRYYRDAIQAWDQALDLAQSWTITYPREASAFNSLGVASLRLGHFEDAVTAFREAVRLDTRFVPAYSNMAAALMALNRFEDARHVLQQAAGQRLDFIGARRLSYLLAFINGDAATMSRELEASIGPTENNAAFGWQARASAFAGRVDEAHEQFRRGVQIALQEGYGEVAARLTMDDAENHAIVGACADARREVTAGLGLSRDNATRERASRALALCGDGDDATGLTRDLARDFPDATLTMRVAIPVTAALVALERRQPAQALEALEPVTPYDHAPSSEFWPVYLRGQAYLQLKDGPNARRAFQQVLDRRGEVPTSVLYPLAHLGLARAATLQGDAAAAQRAYATFLALWKDGDPDSRPLRDARAESSRLQVRAGTGRMPPARVR